MRSAFVGAGVLTVALAAMGAVAFRTRRVVGSRRSGPPSSTDAQLAVVCDRRQEIARTDRTREHILCVPYIDPILQALLAAAPRQGNASHIARALALDVDRQRNLAETVTVDWAWQ